MHISEEDLNAIRQKLCDWIIRDLQAIHDFQTVSESFYSEPDFSKGFDLCVELNKIDAEKGEIEFTRLGILIHDAYSHHMPDWRLAARLFPKYVIPVQFKVKQNTFSKRRVVLETFNDDKKGCANVYYSVEDEQREGLIPWFLLAEHGRECAFAHVICDTIDHTGEHIQTELSVPEQILLAEKMAEIIKDYIESEKEIW